jgi:hypothetical protein
MGKRKLSKTVTMSLVAMAAATGAAVVGAPGAAAAPDTDAVVNGDTIPGLTVPFSKIQFKVPGLRTPPTVMPGIKIASKIAEQKIAGIIHKVSLSPPTGDIG